MAKSVRDIVPTFVVPEQRAPVDILRDLGDTLAKKTGYKVWGDVSTLTDRTEFTHSFRARVSRLDNYLYDLFRVKHSPTELYPVKISGEVAKEILGNNFWVQANDEDEFLDFLATIFASAEMNKVITSLLAQAKA